MCGLLNIFNYQIDILYCLTEYNFMTLHCNSQVPAPFKILWIIKWYYGLGNR